MLFSNPRYCFSVKADNSVWRFGAKIDFYVTFLQLNKQPNENSQFFRFNIYVRTSNLEIIR